MASKMSNKILVTGSAGFIGSHLMKKLGDRGIGFDKKSPDDHLRCDITTTRGIELIQRYIIEFKPQAIIHLAAISSLQDAEKDPKLVVETNVSASYDLMKLAHQYNVPIILASSAAVLEPHTSLYALSKTYMEECARRFDNAIIVRLYNVYGKGSRSVVNLFTEAIRDGRKVYLNGKTSRDYVYVDDVVNVLIRIAEEPKDKLYFVGTGIGTTLTDLVGIIERVTGKRAQYEERAPIQEIQHSLCLEDLDFTQCKTEIDVGIYNLIS